MWAIRFLNGSLAGREIPLQEGTYTLGRSEECQITVSDAGISKKHAKLEVYKEEVVIYDLRSSNGTFVNGVQVQEKEISTTDKVSLGKTTFDIVKSQAQNQMYPAGQLSVAKPYAGNPQAQAPGMMYQAPPAPAGYPADFPHPPGSPVIPGEENPRNQKLSFIERAQQYLEKVVLPGVYKLPELFNLKWVIGSSLVAFIFFMTLLSAFPLMKILNSSIAQESMNHAESIAITLAKMNSDAIKDDIYSAASVEYAVRRPGVSQAFIISASTGKIIAPADRAHTYSKLPFVNAGRTKTDVTVTQIDSNTVGAMVPILFYNSNTSTQGALAYSVVVYDMKALAIGNRSTISLLIQNAFIALVLGIVMFFFLYKIVEYPFISLDKQLHSALTNEALSVETSYDFPPLQNLVNNINSALSRIASEQDANQQMGNYDRITEMEHVIEMIGYPTLGIEMESMKIKSVSANFEEETGMSSERIFNVHIQDIEDQALKLNLDNLLERVQKHPQEIATDMLDFSGVEFQLSAKGIYGKDGLAYTLISFLPINQEEEAAG